jgi:PhnB protein
MPPPPGYHSVNPYIVVAGAAEFIAFLTTVFDGVEQEPRELRDDAAINHAEVMIGDSVVMISEADDTYDARPCVNFTYVDNVDAAHDRALAAGARPLVPPTDQAWGDRVSGIVDPFDNRWWIATRRGDD